jgi:hypothetical protein
VPLELDELVEHWTLLDDDQALVAGKRGEARREQWNGNWR